MKARSYKFKNLYEDKLKQFKHLMQKDGFISCDADLAVIATKIGFESQIGPIHSTGYSLEMGPYISENAYKVATSVRKSGLSSNAYFHTYVKSKKSINLPKVLGSLYRLGGDEVISNFLLEEMKKMGYYHKS